MICSDMHIFDIGFYCREAVYPVVVVVVLVVVVVVVVVAVVVVVVVLAVVVPYILQGSL